EVPQHRRAPADDVVEDLVLTGVQLVRRVRAGPQDAQRAAQERVKARAGFLAAAQVDELAGSDVPRLVWLFQAQDVDIVGDLVVRDHRGERLLHPGDPSLAPAGTGTGVRYSVSGATSKPSARPSIESTAARRVSRLVKQARPRSVAARRM